MELSSELIEIETGKRRSVLASWWDLLATVFSNALHFRK
jgi:hypothetical protein